MGASESKQAASASTHEGIVTVSTRTGPRGPSSGADSDQLLQHLLSLRALVPDVEARVGKSDASSVWRDIESAKQLGADTQELAAAVAQLLGAYREWHSEVRRGHTTSTRAQRLLRAAPLRGAPHLWVPCCTAARDADAALAGPAVPATSAPAPPTSHARRRAAALQHARAIAANQDYINRCIDQAEAKAARALRHLRLQLQRIRALNTALSDASSLPALLQEVTQQAASLQARCDRLAAEADAAAEALAAGAGAAAAGRRGGK